MATLGVEQVVVVAVLIVVVIVVLVVVEKKVECGAWGEGKGDWFVSNGEFG